MHPVPAADRDRALPLAVELAGVSLGAGPASRAALQEALQVDADATLGLIERLVFGRGCEPVAGGGEQCDVVELLVDDYRKEVDGPWEVRLVDVPRSVLPPGPPVPSLPGWRVCRDVWLVACPAAWGLDGEHVAAVATTNDITDVAPAAAQLYAAGGFADPAAAWAAARLAA